eukprot:515359-Pelagomonas_calceolata.AAC.1
MSKTGNADYCMYSGVPGRLSCNEVLLPFFLSLLRTSCTQLALYPVMSFVCIHLSLVRLCNPVQDCYFSWLACVASIFRAIHQDQTKAIIWLTCSSLSTMQFMSTLLKGCALKVLAARIYGQAGSQCRVRVNR